MATDSDLTVTKVTVVLNTPADWYNWLFLRKDTCRHHKLWQYVDPDTPKEDLPELIPPVEPNYTSYNADATSLADLNAADRSSYKWDYERYERLHAEYLKKEKALANLNLEIGRTLAKRHIYLIQNCETAHERLVILKKYLAPDVAARRHDIRTQYIALKAAPRSVKKIEQWLADWTRITALGKSISLPDTQGTNPIEDFLIARTEIDNGYATTCLRDLYKAENEGTTDQLPTLDDYI